MSIIKYENITKEESKIVARIVQRAQKLLKKKLDIMSENMDITAAHCNNGDGLRLKEFLEADAFNFIHDYVGINNHIDRKTGKLTKGFLPRFSK